MSDSKKNDFTQEQIDQLDKFLAVSNQGLRGGFRGSASSLISGGDDLGDRMHDVFLDYGYPEQLNFNNFWNMYRRFGIAKNIIELPPATCWLTPPEIKGIKEADLKTLVEKKKLWQRCLALDKRQRVGQYAGFFMRVKDSKDPKEPIDGVLPGIDSLEAIVPLYENQLWVEEIDRDIKSANYGLPTMYQFRGGVDGNRNPDDQNTFNIHPDRIIIASENADNGGIYGFSALEACYNSLMDLRKIAGGGGEGFYRNAAQSIVFETKDDSQVLSDQTSLDKFNEQVELFIRERMRKNLYAPGMNTKVLESQLMSPKEFFQVSLNDCAAASSIPATILIGMQTGRLASTEDSDHFLTTQQSRRENFLTEMIQMVFDWMIEKGVLASTEYEIEWDDLLSAGDDEKLNLADKMSAINEKQFRSGGDIPFSGDEIREAAGYEEGSTAIDREEFTEDIDPELEKSLTDEPQEDDEDAQVA